MRLVRLAALGAVFCILPSVSDGGGGEQEGAELGSCLLAEQQPFSGCLLVPFQVRFQHVVQHAWA